MLGNSELPSDIVGPLKLLKVPGTIPSHCLTCPMCLATQSYQANGVHWPNMPICLVDGSTGDKAGTDRNSKLLHICIGED